MQRLLTAPECLLTTLQLGQFESNKQRYCCSGTHLTCSAAFQLALLQQDADAEVTEELLNAS